MAKRAIVNIITFIRAVEPRCEMDLIKPVEEQIRLLNSLNLPATFLLQYDALISGGYVEMLKGLDKTRFETGVWLEIVEPLVKKAGIEWRGKYPWDWHANCGFSVGYSKSEREKLIDVLFEDYKEIFGEYPRVMGSWAIDAYTLDYAVKKYGLSASCTCKEQIGTDGYNLWGGYYGQAYYPNRENMLSPAQNKKNQIDVPIFRMLGSDPVYQYDIGLDLKKGIKSHGVISLEPLYIGDGGGGGNQKWVDWFLRENFNDKCLSFSYAQTGQENSFGWDAMKNGIEYQFKAIAAMRDAKKLEVEPLGRTGRWYKKTYLQTPPSAITATTDWLESGKKSVWYSCKNYRLNIYAENGRFWVRDMYLFRDGYKERYLDSPCKEESLTFDTLPVIDGVRFCGNGIRSGLYPCEEDGDAGVGMKFDEMLWKETDKKATITFTKTPCGNFSITLSEDSIEISADETFMLIPAYHSVVKNIIEKASVHRNTLRLTYRGFDYEIKIKTGTISKDFCITSQKNIVRIFCDK